LFAGPTQKFSPQQKHSLGDIINIKQTQTPRALLLVRIIFLTRSGVKSLLLPEWEKEMLIVIAKRFLFSLFFILSADRQLNGACNLHTHKE
jgi:hypothetical protein